MNRKLGNRSLGNPELPNPLLTDAELDAALGSDRDGILPSSGFADGVMFAVQADAAAPAPIPFPWKRAIPTMIAAAGTLVLLVVWFVKAWRSGPATASGGTIFWGGRHLDVALLLHQAANPDALWVVVSLAIPLVCLLVMRRVLFGR